MKKIVFFGVIFVLVFVIVATCCGDIKITGGGSKFAVRLNNGNSAFYEAETYGYEGTGKDSGAVVGLATIKSGEVSKEFHSRFDAAIGTHFAEPRPVVVVPPVVHHCPPPVMVVPPICAAPCLAPPACSRPVTLMSVTWITYAQFRAYVPRKGWCYFRLPAGTWHLYSCRPLRMTGWVYYSGGTLMFLDACTGVHIPDP